jgi:hypothetical protein
MSEEPGPQFDRAEFESAGVRAQCAACGRALQGYYYEANGATVCEACRYAIEAQLTAGSGLSRSVRAIAAGTLAAVLGAVLYYAIGALTGYEFGLIAIVVGYAVGAAVRWGSGNRGGWRYQALAMLLTYLAIVGTYIPPIVRGLRESAAQAAAAEAPAHQDAGTPAAVATPAASTTETAAQTDAAPGLGAFAIAFAIILVIAMAAPFLAGIENIVGLIIIGIGLYEAWKLNKRTTLTITGPHAIAAPLQA